MIGLPRNYGYVFAVLGASTIMNGYLTSLVLMARKKYGVKYPTLYAPPGHKYEAEFNSVQRSHQNTLETYAIVMLQMCACGFVYPITSAVCGGLWVLGRIIYGYGYSSGGPSGRHVGGAISHLGDIPLIVISFKIAYDMIFKSAV